MPELRDNADSQLRGLLLESAVDFRQTMSAALEGQTIENGETVWDHLSRRVDALLADEAVVFRRYEFPDEHPLSPKYGGDPTDLFELGPDDVVRRSTAKSR
jgi:hypothetical protein